MILLLFIQFYGYMAGLAQIEVNFVESVGLPCGPNVSSALGLPTMVIVIH